MAERPASADIKTIEFHGDRVMVKYKDDTLLFDVNATAKDNQGVDFYILGHSSSGRRLPREAVLVPDLSKGLERRARLFAERLAPIRKEKASASDASQARIHYQRGREFGDKVRQEFFEAMKNNRLSEATRYPYGRLTIKYKDSAEKEREARCFVQTYFDEDGKPQLNLAQIEIRVNRTLVLLTGKEVLKEIRPALHKLYQQLS